MGKQLKEQITRLKAENSRLKESQGHAFLSPSFAHTGLNCAASALRTFQVEQRVDLFRQAGAEFFGLQTENDIQRWDAINDPDDQASRDGTAFHEVFEFGIVNRATKKSDYKKQLKKIHKRGLISTDSYEDSFLLDRLFAQAQTQLEDLSTASWIGVECGVKVKGLPEYGTVDLAFIVDRTLYIRDLKTGRNEVASKNNQQLIIYAIGVLEHVGWDNIDKVEIGILGVRWDAESWTTSVKKLAKFKKERLLPAFFDAYGINPEATAGDWCQYCSAKIHCREWQEKFQGAITNETFDNIDVKEHDSQGLVDLFKLCKQAQNLVQHQLQPEILRRFEGFSDIPKITRVSGRKSEVWAVDEKTVTKKLAKKAGGKDALYTKKLASPKDVKAAMGNDPALKKLTKTTQSKPYLKV